MHSAVSLSLSLSHLLIIDVFALKKETKINKIKVKIRNI
jgi:hypothetical protein